MPIFLKIWVGYAFAFHAAPVGEIVLIGIWINGLAYIPYGHLQASNRPDLAAKFHLAELLPFICSLWIGVHYFGLIGAAWAWTARMAVDAVLLFTLTGQSRGWQSIIPGASLVLLAPLCAPENLTSIKTLFAVVLVFVSAIWAWYLSPSVRNVVTTRFRRTILRNA